MTTSPTDLPLPFVDPTDDLLKAEHGDDTGEIPLAVMERILNS